MQPKSDNSFLVVGVINDLMKRQDLWSDYVNAISEAEGSDMDFPELDQRVARVWELNGRLLDEAQEILPSMNSNRQLFQSVNAALWRAATGKKL